MDWRTSKRIGIGFLVGMVLWAISATGVAAEAEGDAGGGAVTFSQGLLSINAGEIRPEDLMKELGNKCDIRVVVFGEVFSEVPISVKFDKLALRKGIERVLRVANVTNFLLHFDKNREAPGIVEIDLIGKKGGEKYLTEGSAVQPAVKKKRTPPKRAAKKSKKKSLQADRKKKDEAEKIQENFLNIMDEVLSSQLEDGVEPDPAEILRMFKDVVPQEMKDQIPPEVLEELEKLE